MLNLNNPLPKSQSAAEPVWKVQCISTASCCVYCINVPVVRCIYVIVFGCSILHSSHQVLVYDRCGQDIISPLLPVKELRDLGVTLHL